MQIITKKEVCGMDNNINAKEIWLNYFNNVLFEKGIIDEKERNKMIILISKNCRTPDGIRGRVR